MSPNHVTLIVLVIIGVQLFARATGWIFVMREEKYTKLYQQFYDQKRAICISVDDGDALIWNTNLVRNSTFSIRYEKVIEGFTESINAKEPNCPFGKQDKCTPKWTADSNYWHFVSSVEKPMGPVFDNRWEAFQQYSLDTDQWSQISEISLWNTLVFSVRSQRDVNFSFYLDSYEAGRFFYGISIGIHSNKNSTINQYHNASFNSSQLLKIETTENILSPKEWRTFVLKLSQSDSEIQIYNTSGLVISAPIYKDIDQNAFTLNTKFATSGLLRFHQYDYLHTEKPGYVLTSPLWENGSPTICIEITVGLCSDCTMTFYLMNQNKEKYHMKTIYGSDVPTVAGLPAWRRVKMKSSLPVEFSNSVRLKISTGITGDLRVGLWAVAMFRICPITDNIRNSTIELVTDYNKHYVWPSITCQKLSYDKGTVIDTYPGKSFASISNQPPCPVGKLGPRCVTECPNSSCEHISMCDENGCSCAPGYREYNCDYPCKNGKYGQDCKNTCKQCADGANCHHVTGNCSDSSDNSDRFHVKPICKFERNVTVSPTKRKVIVWMTSDAENPCSRAWYKVSLKLGNVSFREGKSNMTNVKLEYIFYDLDPFTEYELLVKHKEEVYYKRTVVTLEDAPTEVRWLSHTSLSEYAVNIYWSPPLKSNGILTGYTVTTKRIALRGCQDYNKTSPSWDRTIILKPHLNSLNITGLHPYAEYSTQVVATTVEPGPSAEVKFETPAHELPTSIVSQLTILNWTVSWKPPENCFTITGPTSKAAIVVRGVSEKVSNFYIKKQTEYNYIDISKLALYGDEIYTVQVYLLRKYHEPLDGIPYQEYTWQTDPRAPPAVTNSEIVEIDTEKGIIVVRWDKPLPPTNGKIVFYKIGFVNRRKEFIAGILVAAETHCDLWPELLCASIRGDTKQYKQIGICANNEGVDSLGELTELSITKTWNLKPPEAPQKVQALSTNYGKVFLTWTHPWRTYNRIKKFCIIIKTLSTNLTKEWITLDNLTTIIHPVEEYRTNYNHTLNLNPSTSYEISVNAITISNVNGRTNKAEVNSTCSVDLNVNFEYTAFNDNSTIALTIPDIVNGTRNIMIYILVKSKESCKPKSVLPKDLKKHVTVNSFQAIWLAAILTSNFKFFTIGDNKTYGGELNCALRPQTIYNVIVIVKSSDEQIAFEPIIMESSPISIGEIPSSINKSWLILIPLLAVVVVIIYLYRHKAKNFFQRQHDIPLTEKVNDVNHENQSVKLPNVEEPSSRFTSRMSRHSSLENSPVVNQRRSHLPPESEYSSMVKVKNFEDYVRQAIATGLLDQQYEMFPRGQTKPWTYGEQPQNKGKNRYKNLLAYDETRVVLEKLPDDPYSDYINANYIQGFNKERAYIATQGPKPNTIIDFWRMIWQEKVLVICMVTNIMENGKIKCEQYWPDIGKKKQYGDFIVANVKHNVLADYTFRTFQVTYEKETRKIEHLHYTSWPDHSIPLYTYGIVAFLKKLLATSPGVGPIVTHCSAGVGRTGTIILCHICLHRAAAEGFVDVLAETKKIRNQRANMVDNKQQYLMAHLVIAECLLALVTHIPCDGKLPERIREMQQHLQIQRQRLEDIAWQDEALQPSSLRKPLPFQNWCKTRYPEEATDNCKRIFLTRYPPSDADSDYIAAIFVDGVKLQNQYLAAQLPLPSTVSDFWRMIAELKIELIVQLQPADPEDHTCSEIVPEDGKFDPTPYLEVNTQDIVDSEYFITRKLLLTDKSKDKKREQRITILSCKSWKPGRHEDLPLPVALVSLWQAAERIPRGAGPVVSVCHDGVTGCGLYLALSFLLERMAVERECDVCLAIRAVRRSRHEFVQTIKQFQFLYDAALTYMEYFETYSNFS